MALNGAERAEVMYSLHGESPETHVHHAATCTGENTQKRYYKCEAYGDGCSTATDWAKSYPACGLWGKPFNRNTMPLGVKHARKFVLKDATSEIEGQLQFGDNPTATEREGEGIE